MISESAEHAPSTQEEEREFPPVQQLAILTFILIVSAGVFSVAYLPDRAPLPFPFVLISSAYVVMVINAILVSQIKEFAWDRFVQVAGWALLAQAVSVGMIEYAFVVDHVRGKLLVMLSMGLFVYGFNVPLLLGFSVARFQPPAPWPKRSSAGSDL
ncbi:MAG TPA: hypothetical protein VFB90_06615 [Dehalococcoidia bacterium]|nr:hypothetical protein [Dehalococcoidia bacterium]